MIRALIVALLAALVGCGALGWRVHSLQATLATERAQHAEQIAQRERERRAYDDALNAGVRKATDAYLFHAAAARRDAADVHAAYRGVLDAIHDAGGTADDPAAGCRAAAERVAVLGRLLGEGAQLAAEGAQRVGRLDAQVQGLQDHARAVSAAGAASEVPVTP